MNGSAILLSEGKQDNNHQLVPHSAKVKSDNFGAPRKTSIINALLDIGSLRPHKVLGVALHFWKIKVGEEARDLNPFILTFNNTVRANAISKAAMANPEQKSVAKSFSNHFFVTKTFSDTSFALD